MGGGKQRTVPGDPSPTTYQIALQTPPRSPGGSDPGVPRRTASWPAPPPTAFRRPGRAKSKGPGRAGSLEAQLSKDRKLGDPRQPRRYCSHGPGLAPRPPHLPRPSLAPPVPSPKALGLPAPPNAARSTHARLAAALALEKSYWSNDLISGTKKVLRSGPDPAGAASTMATPGLRPPGSARSDGLGCAALRCAAAEPPPPRSGLPPRPPQLLLLIKLLRRR